MMSWLPILLSFVLVIQNLHLSAASDKQATFDGTGYVTYRLDDGAVKNNADEILLQFKTKQISAFLFYSGSRYIIPAEAYYISLWLDEGFLMLRIFSQGSEIYNRKMECVSQYKTCSDNEWHSLLISREGAKISIEVDNRKFPNENIKNIPDTLASRSIYLAGLPSGVLLSSTTPNPGNFKGCIQQVFFKVKSVLLNLLDIVRSPGTTSAVATTVGGVTYANCSNLFPLEPITFANPESFLLVPSWKAVSQGRLEISFRTNEANGLLIYQHSSDRSSSGRRDFLALELRDSQLYFLINTGSGTYQSFVGDGANVSDETWHRVLFVFSEGFVTVTLDNFRSVERRQTTYQYLNLNGALYLGGLPSDIRASLPHEVWSGVLGHSFVGCMKDLSIDQRSIDLVLEFRANRSSATSESILPGCRPPSPFNQCQNRPCNQGKCSLGWNRFICDCSTTNYTGRTCTEKAPIVQFNGFQYMRVKLQRGFQTEAEDVSLRFRTSKSEGLLFVAKSDSGATDRMELLIEEGKIVIVLNFGKGQKKFKSDVEIADNRWHTAKIKRRSKNLVLTVDENIIQFEIKSSGKLLSHGDITVGRSPTADTIQRNFIGHMMHFRFNGASYFTLAQQYSPPYIEVTASLDFADSIRQFPVHFTTPNAFLLLPKVGIFGDFRLEFQFKTTQPQGLVLLLDGESGDFLTLELMDGQLHLLYNWGSGSWFKQSTLPALNDGRWHTVSLVRSNSVKRSMAFRVDGLPSGADAEVMVKPGGMNFNRLGDLYLGGVKIGFPTDSKFKSQVGFAGCIANFVLNKTTPGLTNDIDLQPIDVFNRKSQSVNVSENCPESKMSCKLDTCYYGGRCIQQWQRLRCDCKMTSFKGETCDKVSTTLKFTETPGYVVFELAPVQNTIKDELAFGIQTRSRKQSSIIHIYGMGLKPDFIKVVVTLDKNRAIIQAMYNMGSNSHSVYEPMVDIADGNYHIVRFVREGPDATLQVDDQPIRKKQPGRSQSSHFNQQKRIHVGQSVWYTTRVKRFTEGSEEPFTGFISGLTFNSVPLNEIVEGQIVSGINIFNRTNVWIEPDFKPNLRDFPPPAKTLPGSTSKEDWQSTPGSKGSGSTGNSPKRPDGLVVPKPGCPDPYSSVATADCQPQDPDGIVRPNVIFKTTGRPTSDDNFNNQQLNKPNLDSSRDSNGNPSTYPDSNNNNNKNPNNNYRDTLKPNPSLGGSDNQDIMSAGFMGINIWLIVAISCGGALILLLVTCVIYRCRRRDEGSYSVDEGRHYVDPATRPLRDMSSLGHPLTNGAALHGSPEGNGASVGGGGKTKKKKRREGAKGKRKEAKEWYV